MDKQELLDKAVEDWQGVYKPDCPFVYGYTGPKNYTSCVFSLLPSYGYIFSKTEFEQRAKELGWVNGYLWGKEYPTNGKKPDLPNNTQVRVVLRNYSILIESVGNINWGHIMHASDVISFSVVDDACKPKQPESHSKPSVDNSWHEKGDLPPVGAEIEVFSDGEEVRQIHVVWSGDDVVFGWDMGAPFVYAHFSAKAYSFRPIKTEKEKFVDAAIKLVELDLAIPVASDKHYFESLYDAGCRFVSQESGR